MPAFKRSTGCDAAVSDSHFSGIDKYCATIIETSAVCQAVGHSCVIDREGSGGTYMEQVVEVRAVNGVAAALHRHRGRDLWQVGAQGDIGAKVMVSAPLPSRRKNRWARHRRWPEVMACARVHVLSTLMVAANTRGSPQRERRRQDHCRAQEVYEAHRGGGGGGASSASMRWQPPSSAEFRGLVASVWAALRRQHEVSTVMTSF